MNAMTADLRKNGMSIDIPFFVISLPRVQTRVFIVSP